MKYLILALLFVITGCCDKVKDSTEESCSEKFINPKGQFTSEKTCNHSLQKIEIDKKGNYICRCSKAEPVDSEYVLE